MDELIAKLQELDRQRERLLAQLEDLELIEKRRTGPPPLYMPKPHDINPAWLGALI